MLISTSKIQLQANDDACELQHSTACARSAHHLQVCQDDTKPVVRQCTCSPTTAILKPPPPTPHEESLRRALTSIW
jgi:hypothetical protein